MPSLCLKKPNFAVKIVAAGVAMFLSACGDSGTTEQVTNNYTSGLDIVASVADLPACGKDNDGDQVFVKDESGIRVCSDSKWYATVDKGASDTVYVNGKDTVYVVKGDTVYLASKDTLYVSNKDTIYVVSSDSSSISSSDENIVLDSEKVAVSLDSVHGASQKGPFLSGSKVLIKELLDGRSLTQTGNNFDGKILNDRGEFKVTARMLMSQYVMLEVNGYYRNEVTGAISGSPLTLFGITDVSAREVVNINLLTHLEYERVYNLVTSGMYTVKKAKKKAQTEILNIMHVDNTGFSNSEDLSIAGSSEEDGALLAFSILFQGDRSVPELTELLTKISTDMEQDGKWDDAATKLSIADWAMAADTSGRLATIRSNVEGWGLSLMVPSFEPYIRNFWRTEYGLDKCGGAGDSSVAVGTVAEAKYGATSGTKVRFTCVENTSGEYLWRTATDYEKDTYGWTAGDDGQVKVGDVTGDKYYLYDGVANAWRKATDQEQLLGGCIASVETDASKNTGMVNGYWYKCESRTWVKTSAFIVDTQGWLEGSDGSLKAGDSTGAWYVWDEYENAWRNASTLDYTLGFNGCTTNRTGEMGHAESYDGNYYQCATDHMWTMVTSTAGINTKDIACDEEGKYITGIVHTKTHFVCDAGTWREATTEEEQAESSCTAASEPHFNATKTKFCENGAFHDATIYDYAVGEKNYFNSDLTYDSLTDARDGHVYKTIKIGEQVWMAENLQFADSISYIYLKGNSWCYNNLEKNCQIGGRYYTWTAAMDIDSKWQNATVPEGTIKTPHQGICPEGWHIPTDNEWTEMYNAAGATSVALQARGTLNWVDATNSSGFSALPVGNYTCGDFFDVGSGSFFWSSPEDNDVVAYSLNVYADNADVAGGYAKYRGFAVRCLQDSE